MTVQPLQQAQYGTSGPDSSMAQIAARVLMLLCIGSQAALAGVPAFDQQQPSAETGIGGEEAHCASEPDRRALSAYAQEPAGHDVQLASLSTTEVQPTAYRHGEVLVAESGLLRVNADSAAAAELVSLGGGMRSAATVQVPLTSSLGLLGLALLGFLATVTRRTI